MIPTGVEVFVATTPVDLRYGFERLSGIVTERIASGDKLGFERRDALCQSCLCGAFHLHEARVSTAATSIWLSAFANMRH